MIPFATIWYLNTEPCVKKNNRSSFRFLSVLIVPYEITKKWKTRFVWYKNTFTLVKIRPYVIRRHSRTQVSAVKPNLYLVEGGTNPLVDTWKSNPSPETRHWRIWDIHTWHRHKLFKGPSKNLSRATNIYANGASVAEASIDGVWLHQQYEYNRQWKVCFVWNIWYWCHQM